MHLQTVPLDAVTMRSVSSSDMNKVEFFLLVVVVVDDGMAIGICGIVTISMTSDA